MKATVLCALFSILVASQLFAQPFAYIANSGTRTVSVIDTADDTIKATIALPDTQQNIHPYPYGITVGPSGQYVYVGLQDTNEVVVIDAASNTVLKRIGLGARSPARLAVNDAETRLYVTIQQSNLLLIYDISGSGAELVTAVAVHDQQISSPEGVVLSPTGDKAYVANSLAASIAVVTLDDGNNIYSRESLIDLDDGFRPMALAIAADGKRLYASGLMGLLKMIDLRDTPAGITTLNSLAGTVAMAITPDSSKVYAPSNVSDVLVEITATESSTTVTGYYPLAAGPFGISVTPDGARLYVTMNTGSYGDSVKVFSTSSNSVTKTIALPADARPTSIGDFIGPVFPHTITATQDSNCNISPLGPVAVNSKGRLFNIVASSGQCEVKVDGVSVGMPGAYAFTNVNNSDHIIDASQAPLGTYYTVTASWPDICIPEACCGGCLSSTPVGISCQSRAAQFIAGSMVFIGTTPGFTASSWTGACAGTSGNTCVLTMNSDKAIGASLACLPLTGPVYNPRLNRYYSTIPEALLEAISGDVIRVSAAYAGPGISGGGPVGLVTISGGWDAPFLFLSGTSNIGPSTITTTGIIVDNLIF